MNKIYIYIGLLFTAILYTSCTKDYLDVIPDNLATIDNAFSDKTNAQKFLFTLYSAIPNPGDLNNPSLNGGDEIVYPARASDRPGTRIALGFQSATSPLYNKWEGRANEDLYVGIRNCNIFIRRIDEVKSLTPAQRTQWKAEAMFLKAYFHYYLVSMYGPIVISDTDIAISEGAEAVSQKRSTIDECFKYIVDLLDKSIVDLPVTVQDENKDAGRITKSIAAAIKARVLITYASPLFNGNASYTDFVNSEGVPFFPLKFDIAKWQKAAQAAKEAITLCEGAGFKLRQKEDYYNGNGANVGPETRLRAALRGRVTEKWDKEIIWAHTAGTASIQYEAMPRLFSYTATPVLSRHCPPLHVAEMYYSSNGVPIDEDVNYDYTNRYKTRVSLTADKFDINVGSETAILNFNREHRFYADLAFDRGVWFGNGKETNENDRHIIRARKGEYSSALEVYEGSASGYWAKKLVNMGTIVRDGRDFSEVRYTFPIIRLADLYLYYAEALNESKATPDAETYKYIDLVRSRAGLKGVVESWTNFSKNPAKPTTQSGLRSILQQERMIEMSFEGDRFWDLRRWKLARQYMNKPLKGWTTTGTNVDEYYNVKTVVNLTFSERDYLWPIPENQIIQNKNLVQNPGW